MLGGWNHSVSPSFFGSKGEPAVGTGRVYEEDDAAIFEGSFNMKYPKAVDLYEVVKFSGELQEWSFAFRVLDSEPRKIDGEEYDTYTRIEVREVSPVYKGAGMDTATLEVRQKEPDPLARLVALEEWRKSCELEQLTQSVRAAMLAKNA